MENDVPCLILTLAGSGKQVILAGKDKIFMEIQPDTFLTVFAEATNPEVIYENSKIFFNLDWIIEHDIFGPERKEELQQFKKELLLQFAK